MIRVYQRDSRRWGGFGAPAAQTGPINNQELMTMALLTDSVHYPTGRSRLRVMMDEDEDMFQFVLGVLLGYGGP